MMIYFFLSTNLKIKHIGFCKIFFQNVTGSSGFPITVFQMCLFPFLHLIYYDSLGASVKSHTIKILAYFNRLIWMLNLLKRILIPTLQMYNILQNLKQYHFLMV